jgi:hypothetical protein
MAGALPDGVEAIVSGVTNPRGFTWRADGELFLALAGTGGPNQVIDEDGTEFPFFTGRPPALSRSRAAAQFPSPRA